MDEALQGYVGRTGELAGPVRAQEEATKQSLVGPSSAGGRASIRSQ